MNTGRSQQARTEWILANSLITMDYVTHITLSESRTIDHLVGSNELCNVLDNVWRGKLCHSFMHRNLRHSGIMHFSASVVSALHMDPSAGVILTIRCRFFIPIPQLALHSSHSPHSVTRQLPGAIHHRTAEDQSTWHSLKSRKLITLSHWLNFAGLNQILAALLVYNAFLCFFSRHFAHRAVFRELLHVSLSRSHSHAARHATGGPCYPLWHHAGGAV